MIIVIEGCDHTGKKTQSKLLYKAFKKRNISTTVLHFPDYSTHIGKEISRYLDRKRKFLPEVIHCLLSANRWEKIKKIQNAVNKYSILIIDRYYQSNLAYGLANGLNWKWLKNLDIGMPEADYVILLDTNKNDLLLRKKKNRDKFENDMKFLLKVSEIYKILAKKLHWDIVCASNSKNQVHESIIKIFESHGIL